MPQLQKNSSYHVFSFKTYTSIVNIVETNNNNVEQLQTQIATLNTTISTLQAQLNGLDPNSIVGKGYSNFNVNIVISRDYLNFI